MTTSTGAPPVPLAERSVVAGRRGLPWWGAVALAFVVTGTGIGIDIARVDTLTRLFLVFYAVGCVAAVLAVAQRSIFTAMVQPPLVLALAVPLVVKLLGGGSGAGGLRNTVLELGLPLVNGFPTMAVTTATTLVLGLARILLQRRAHPTARRAAPRTEARRARIEDDHDEDDRPRAAAPRPRARHADRDTDRDELRSGRPVRGERA